MLVLQGNRARPRGDACLHLPEGCPRAQVLCGVQGAPGVGGHLRLALRALQQVQRRRCAIVGRAHCLLFLLPPARMAICDHGCVSAEELHPWAWLLASRAVCLLESLSLSMAIFEYGCVSAEELRPQACSSSGRMDTVYQPHQALGHDLHQ